MERPEEPEDLAALLRRDSRRRQERTPAQTSAEERVAQLDARRGAMLIRVVAQLEQDAAVFAGEMRKYHAVPDMNLVVGHRPVAPVKSRLGLRRQPQGSVPIYDKVWVASACAQRVTETKPSGRSYGTSIETTTNYRGLAIDGEGILLTYAGVPKVEHSAHEGTERTAASSTHRTEWDHTDIGNIVGPLTVAGVSIDEVIPYYDIDPAFGLPDQRVFRNFRERLTAINAQIGS